MGFYIVVQARFFTVLQTIIIIFLAERFAFYMAREATERLEH